MLKRLMLSAAVITAAGCSLFEEGEEILPGERIPVRATIEEQIGQKRPRFLKDSFKRARSVP